MITLQRSKGSTKNPNQKGDRMSSEQCPVSFYTSHLLDLTLRPPVSHRALTHIHLFRSRHIKPHQTARRHTNTCSHRRARAHVPLTDRLCCPLPFADDRSLPVTGWPLTGRTASVSTAWNPCLRDQRTSWAPVVSGHCLNETHCSGSNYISSLHLWLMKWWVIPGDDRVMKLPWVKRWELVKRIINFLPHKELDERRNSSSTPDGPVLS